MTALSLILALALGPVPYESMKETPRPQPARAWVALCDTDAKACADTLFDLTWEKSVGAQKVNFCLPQEGAPEPIARKVADWLKARPELGGGETDAALLKALAATHPC